MVKKKSNKKYGFTLAEILVSMLILSVMFLALTRITNHKASKEIERTPHGFYECYTLGGTTFEYRTHTNFSKIEGSDEKQEATALGAGQRCMFIPPKNVYFININCFDNENQRYLSSKESMFNENVEFDSPVALMDEDNENYTNAFNVRQDENYADRLADFTRYLRVSHQDSHLYDILTGANADNLSQILFIAW